MIINKSKYNSDWETKTIEELGNLSRGKSKHRPRNDKALLDNGIYPLIQTGEIKDANLFITNHKNNYNEFGLKQSKLWTTNTLCITIAANIAETALLGYPMCFPDSVAGFNAFPDKTSEIFMHYVITFIKKTIQNSASGSSQDNINIDYLTRIKFKIPTLLYQQKIVAILSSLDSKIEINNKINTELEAMAKTLYDYWFVQFDFPDKNGKPYKSSGGKMVYNEVLKREIPVCWEVKELSNIERNIVTGKTPLTSNNDFYNGNIPFITIGDVRGNMHIVSTQQTLTKEGANQNIKKFIPKNSICVTCIASVGLIGFSTEDSQTNQQLNSIICENYENRYFLYFYLLNYFKYSIPKTGNTFANINKADFSSILVIKPKKEILIHFSAILKSSISKILNNSKENQQLTELRDWLLPMLMNGQVTVSDESAFGKDEVLAMVAERSATYEKTVKVVAEKIATKKPKKETKPVIKLNNVDVYKRTLLAAEIVYQYRNEYTLGHLKLQKMLYLCKESENMNLPMNFLKQAMGPYDNQLARSLDKQFEEKKWFKYRNGDGLKYTPLENCSKHSEDFKKYFEEQLPTINKLIETFRKFKSQEIEAVATLYACWKEAIVNKELINDAMIINKFYNWSEEKKKFNKPDLVVHLAWMRTNGIYPKN